MRGDLAAFHVRVKLRLLSDGLGWSLEGPGVSRNRCPALSFWQVVQFGNVCSRHRVDVEPLCQMAILALSFTGACARVHLLEFPGVFESCWVTSYRLVGYSALWCCSRHHRLVALVDNAD